MTQYLPAAYIHRKAKRVYLYAARTYSEVEAFVLARCKAGLDEPEPAYCTIGAELPADFKPNTYKGWQLSFEYGDWTAVHDNYDAEWQGEEDGWVDNGLRLGCRQLADLLLEIEEHEETKHDN